MTFFAQTGFVLALVGGLGWGSSRFNTRFRRDDEVWQRALQRNVAVCKGLLTTGGLLIGVAVVLAVLAAIF
ncbi:MAG: hypothetical protein U0P45_17125 [Acidimicrobiales bacterium]